jgi:hypothetical protein
MMGVAARRPDPGRPGQMLLLLREHCRVVAAGPLEVPGLQRFLTRQQQVAVLAPAVLQRGRPHTQEPRQGLTQQQFLQLAKQQKLQ